MRVTLHSVEELNDFVEVHNGEYWASTTTVFYWWALGAAQYNHRLLLVGTGSCPVQLSAAGFCYGSSDLLMSILMSLFKIILYHVMVRTGKGQTCVYTCSRPPQWNTYSTVKIKAFSLSLSLSLSPVHSGAGPDPEEDLHQLGQRPTGQGEVLVHAEVPWRRGGLWSF